MQYTNPRNHQRFIENPDLVPDRFMKYTELEEYLSKAILLLKELCPDNELWRNEAGLSNIEGENSGGHANVHRRIRIITSSKSRR